MSALHDLARRGIYVGVTAWTEPTLIEAGYYPPDADTADERLRYYANEFPITEVDSTYYAPASEHVAQLWAERTPVDFVFDVKAFRLLTEHPTPPKSLWKDIRESLPGELATKRNVYAKDLSQDVMDEALDRFLSALRPLCDAGKLGVVLLQFPEYVHPVKRSYAHLDWLASRLGDDMVGAVEFRQGKWMDDDHRDTTLSFLEERGFAYVSVDEPQGFKNSVPPIASATADVAVVRFHERNAETWNKKGITAAERFRYDYTEHPEVLREWVPKIEELHDGDDRPVHALMNNCYADYGIRSGRALAQLLVDE